MDSLVAKVLSWYPNIKQYIERGKCNPRTLYIQPSNVCNNRCKGCYYLKSRVGFIKFMDVLTMKSLIADSIRDLGILGISLSGGGEPSLHPKFKDIIKFLNKTKKALSLVTNGTWKDKEISKLLAKNFIFVRVGLDCCDRKQYRKIKKRDVFNSVVSNIKDLVKYKEKATIGIKFLLRKHNCKPEDVYRMIDLGRKLGVDYMHFKILMNDITQPTKKQIEKLGMSLYQLNDDRVIVDIEETTISRKCMLNMLRVNVDTDGSVYLCSRYHHRMNKHCIGNIHKKNISEIWYGDEHWEAMNNINPEQCNLYNCMLHRAHKVMDENILNNKYHLEFAA